MKIHQPTVERQGAGPPTGAAGCPALVARLQL